MAKTKEIFAEQILRELSADPLTRDFKIFPREVYPRMDAVVNDMAVKQQLINWSVNYGGTSEMYLTTWGLNDDAIEVTDPENEGASYFDLPVNYNDLPRNGGINQIIPMDNAEITVIITTLREYRLYKSSPAGGMQGKLAAYPIGSRMFFNQSAVKQNFGDMMVRLMVRDSSQIAANAPYPIPSDKELMMIKICVSWFRDRIEQGIIDPIRDGNLQMIK